MKAASAFDRSARTVADLEQFWRDDPLAAGCALNQFMNSAFLVPDE